jgi:DNA-binding FadR family transcriptional regulator
MIDGVTASVGAPKKAQSRVNLVMEHIKNAVMSGALKGGDRLPSELEIAETLGVSRTPVREAIKVLDVVGVIEVRHGSGTFVRPGVQAALSQLLLFQTYLTDTTPQKLMEVRGIFEKNCAELAAERRTDADLADMRNAIEHLRSLAADPNATHERILQADLAFHRLVYRASGNELIESIANFVLTMVAPWIGKSLRHMGPQNAIKLHEIMLIMLESGNANAAREFTASKGFGHTNPVDANMLHFRDTITE